MDMPYLHLASNAGLSHIVLMQWDSSPSVQAHTKTVSALCVNPQEGCVVTGGSDSLLKVWKLGEGVHRSILLSTPLNNVRR